MREKGIIIKQRGKNLHTAVIFPGPYNVAMSSLAYQNIYSFLNGLNGVLCDRFVLDRNTSLEHNLTYMDYKAVFITVPFILNIPDILRICNRDLVHKEFTKVICIGGMAAAANIELFFNCDAIVFPGSLESHTEHIKRVLSLIRLGAKRDEIIKEMQPIVLKENMELTEKEPLDCEPSTSVIYTKNTEFANMHLVEVSRGCTGSCNFCMSKHLTGHYREFKYENIIKAIDKSPVDIKTIGLIGDAVLTHSKIGEIVEYILHRKKRPSFASIRIADLNPKKIPLILKSDIRTLTIAPEVATERLMKITNKYYDRPSLFETLIDLINGGVMNIKLYMMIGLPNETLEDIKDMIDFILDIRNILVRFSRKKGRLGILKVSINNFVPSPFTPLAKERPDTVENLKNKQKLITTRLSDYSNLSISTMDIFETIYQTALFRADSSFAQKIIHIEDVPQKKLFNKDKEFAKYILSLAYQNH